MHRARQFLRQNDNIGEIKMDILQKAFRQYESAMGSAAATGDRLCQMEAMDGAARCLEALRLQHKICNCRPLEFNTRLLEVAGSVGAKVNCQYTFADHASYRFREEEGAKEMKRGRRREWEGTMRCTVKSIPFLPSDVRTWMFLPFLFSSLRRSKLEINAKKFFPRRVFRTNWKVDFFDFKNCPDMEMHTSGDWLSKFRIKKINGKYYPSLENCSTFHNSLRNYDLFFYFYIYDFFYSNTTVGYYLN